MLRLLGNRLAQLVPVLIGVSFLTTLLLGLLPGNAAVAILGQNATPGQVASLSRQLGLDQSVFVRYWDWLEKAVQGNLGTSLTTQQRVSTLIAQRVPVSAEEVFLAILIALVLAVPVAILAARMRGRWVDRGVSAWSYAGVSVAPFLLALVLIYVLAVKARVLPATGYAPLSSGLGANLRTMLLPALTLSFGAFGLYTRLLRGEFSTQLWGEEYVSAARARGVSERGVLYRHVLRNSVFSLVTAVGLDIGRLISGAVIIETIFALPGLGQLLITSIDQRDIPVVQGVVIVVAVVVVAANLLVDLLYAWLDPRIRHGAAS